MEEEDYKTKLLKGADELFLKYGLRSVTMDDMARHLGVSKKTIYQHFSDKDDVVESVTKLLMEQQRSEFEKIALQSKNSVEQLLKISRCLKETMRRINPSLLFDMQKYHQKAWNNWLAFKHNFIRETVKRNLENGVQQGYFRPEMDTEVLVIMRMEQIQMAFDHSVFPREHFDLAEVQAQLFEHFVFGLFTDKGRKLYLKYKDSEIELSNH